MARHLFHTTCCGLVFYEVRRHLPDVCPVCESKEGDGTGLWRRIDR